MKKVFLLSVFVFLTACNDEPKTVYYYMQHETELKEVLNKCISGELDRYSTKCDTVKLARDNLFFMSKGIKFSEKQLKEFGKK